MPIAAVREEVVVPELAHPGQPIPVAVRMKGWVFSSPVGPRDPASKVVPEALDDQLALTFANLDRVLAAAGCSREDVASVTVTLVDRGDRPALNDHWSRYFGTGCPPARQVVQDQLPEGARVLLRFVAASPAGEHRG